MRTPSSDLPVVKGDEAEPFDSQGDQLVNKVRGQCTTHAQADAGKQRKMYCVD